MLLNKNYVLGNELCDLLSIEQSNISMYRKEREDSGDFTAVVKLGGVTAVDTSSKFLPNYLQITPEQKEKLTPLYNKLPVRYLATEHNLTEQELGKIGGDSIELQGTKFWVFEESLIQRLTKKMRNTVTYTLNEEEYDECLKKGLISGGIQLKRSKFFVWYFV